ncbi:hypothetical protein, partial [Brucella anthropi]|uniref:hypothetical protein n=1 Tax=Brucella anthropi TaxID=529 RepID=UPI001AEFA51E
MSYNAYIHLWFSAVKPSLRLGFLLLSDANRQSRMVAEDHINAAYCSESVGGFFVINARFPDRRKSPKIAGGCIS